MVQIRRDNKAPPCAAAPMAGTAWCGAPGNLRVADAAYVINEMVSAKALTYVFTKVRELMELSSPGTAGGYPGCSATAHRPWRRPPSLLWSTGLKSSVLNMSCHRRSSSGCGGRLLEERRCAAGLSTVKKAVPVPVTVKIRKAGTPAQSTPWKWRDLRKRSRRCCRSAGPRADAALPPRTGSIRQVKEAVSIPVIGSGDIFSRRERCRHAGADRLRSDDWPGAP